MWNTYIKHFYSLNRPGRTHGVAKLDISQLQYTTDRVSHKLEYTDTYWRLPLQRLRDVHINLRIKKLRNTAQPKTMRKYKDLQSLKFVVVVVYPFPWPLLVGWSPILPFVGHQPASPTICAVTPTGPHGRLAQKRLIGPPLLRAGGFDIICTSVCSHNDSSTACRSHHHRCLVKPSFSISPHSSSPYYISLLHVNPVLILLRHRHVVQRLSESFTNPS